MKHLVQSTLTILLLCVSLLLHADELIVNAGGGKQYGASQHNRTFGLDYSFYRKVRSNRQHLLLGLSLTRMSTDVPGSKTILAISLYPQLNLYSKRQSWGQPFFFVRALGPSYISSNQLGARKQKNHFAFQAQVGIGAYLNYQEKKQGIIMLSFKHFSNAGIFNVNEGFNFPVVLSIGAKF